VLSNFRQFQKDHKKTFKTKIQLKNRGVSKQLNEKKWLVVNSYCYQNIFRKYLKISMIGDFEVKKNSLRFDKL
jgi:hypothetical protein